MVYVCGSDELKRTISSRFSIVFSVKEASCIVVEIPASIETIDENASHNIPVLAVATSMFSLSDLRIIRDAGAALVKEESLVQEISKVIMDNKMPELQAATLLIDETKVETPDLNPASFISPPEKNQTYDFKKPIAEPKGGLVVSSASSVTNVGKTFLAINIGTYAALNGVKSVVIDADTVGDTAQALGTELKGSFVTTETWKNFDLNDSNSFLKHKSGLHIIPGDRGQEVITPDDMQDLILNLSRYFYLVVIDHGNNPFLKSSKTALAMSDKIFILANQSQKTLDKGVRLFEENRNLENSRFTLVVNMVNPMGYFKPSEIAKKMGFANYEEIPMDSKGVNAAIRAKKAVIQQRGSQAGKAIIEITEKYLFRGDYALEKQAVGFWEKFLRRS